jgi:hypothetical protein
MTEFKLASKIIWRRELNKDISETFYSSFYKDIEKRESFFKENFKVEFVDATVDKLRTLFFPLYVEEIMNRQDFSLDKNEEEMRKELEDKLNGSVPYKFMFIFHESKLVTAALFSLKNNGLYVGYRAVKKIDDKNLNHKATVSYWGEKLLFNYGKELGVAFFSYGKDSNPYIGKGRVGLPLYKIKTGMRPKRPLPTTDFSDDSYSEEMITKLNEPVLFFCNEDSDGYYQNCYLYFPNGSINESYLKELTKVISWAGINFNVISY